MREVRVYMNNSDVTSEGLKQVYQLWMFQLVQFALFIPFTSFGHFHTRQVHSAEKPNRADDLGPMNRSTLGRMIRLQPRSGARMMMQVHP